MTPAKLHALVEVENHRHQEAERGAGHTRGARPEVSTNPQADLAWLAGMGT